MATIKDIAKLLNISTGTVSKGLNGGEDVSEELRDRIFDTAISIGYTTKKMKDRNSWTACIFIENVDYSANNQFGYEIVLGFKQLAIRNGYNVEIVNITPEMQKVEKYDTYMMKHGYKGGFFVGFYLSDPWLKNLDKTTVPTVLLDNIEPDNPFVAYIGTDSYEGMNAAVHYLHSMGHNSIAFLNGDSDSMISKNRTEAFLKACRNTGIYVDDNFIKYGDYTTECAGRFVKDFIEMGVTAIMCGSDIIAMGVISECQSLGYSIPDDISVIGFDDLPLSAHMTPSLTTIKQERINLGKLGFLTLYSLISGVHISHTLLRPAFVIRDSIGTAKER